MSDHLTFPCWRCGEPVADVPLPLSRSEACPHCGADLHVCRQCEFYDTSKANACREPIAEQVNDKTRANFCGYLSIDCAPKISQGGDNQASAELNDLFGLDGQGTPSPSSSGEAQTALDELFGLNNKNEEN